MLNGDDTRNRICAEWRSYRQALSAGRGEVQVKRFFAVALSAAAVMAVIIALQFAPRGRAAPVQASSGSHHPIKLRNWVPPKHRLNPMWVIPAHSGAVATTSST